MAALPLDWKTMLQDSDYNKHHDANACEQGHDFSFSRFGHVLKFNFFLLSGLRLTERPNCRNSCAVGMVKSTINMVPCFKPAF
jgi:hypothetical protein